MCALGSVSHGGRARAVETKHVCKHMMSKVDAPWCVILSGGAVLLVTDDAEGAFSQGEGIGPQWAMPMSEEYIELNSLDAEWQWLSSAERRERRRAFRAACRVAAFLFDVVITFFIVDDG